MEKTALFPGSFDPLTTGHVAVVERGLAIFDHVVVGVGFNPDKRSLLSPRKRVALAEQVFAGNNRVSVALYEGLTGSFCRSRGIRHILRGVRNSADFEFEQTLDVANSQLYPEITTTVVFTPAELIAVSSKLVREILSMGGDASPFLPANIDITKYL
ncbi:MAG: pantetheine-phosphate adenylyltransferase [Rikenellaceae bacterium]|jgi:pantetheine-phosphate adenylyltransferase|nr:pantetheine-phosphate adenylyltransferase [Rikenellaceae bacterium]